MRKEELFDVISDIDEKKISDANPISYVKDDAVEMPKKAKGKKLLFRYGSIAIAACLLLVVGFTMPEIIDKNAEEIIENNQEQEQITADDFNRNNVNEEKTDASGKQNSDGEVIGDKSIESVGEPNIERTGAPLKNGAISVCYALTQWENKTVAVELADQLQAADPDEQFEIIASPYVDYDFVYQGNTLGEYYRVMANNKIMPEVLAELLKEGDSLKYGEALYETGDKDGIKWDKNLYEQKIRFYGEELLAKYIVDGEFLADKVREDIAAIQADTKESIKAYKACWYAYMDSIARSFPKLNQAEIKGDYFVLHMTREEFASFMPEKVEAWTFRTNVEDDGEIVSAAE